MQAVAKADRLVVTHYHAEQAQGKQQNEREKVKHQQDSPDEAANASCVYHRPATGVHGASIHLFEITCTHDPGGNAQRRTDPNQAQNPEYQNESASMWFHKHVGSGCPDAD